MAIFDAELPDKERFPVDAVAALAIPMKKP